MTNVMDFLKRRRPLAKSFRPASEASADCLALWRPAWEVGPLLWHATASAFALGLWSGGVLSGFPALALGGIPAGLALLLLIGFAVSGFGQNARGSRVMRRPS